MGWWKKDTADPVMRIFLDRYKLNLLSIPREKIAVGDLYVYDGKRTSSPGSIKYFLEPPLKLPPLSEGESMAEVSTTMTQSVDFEVGINFLDNFLSSFGIGVIIGKIKSAFQFKRARTIRYGFTNATRDSVDVMHLGRTLMKHQLNPNHPLYSKDNKYFLVTAVARTPSLSMLVEDENSKAVDIDLGAINTEIADGKAKIEKSEATAITVKTDKQLGFGVELHELTFDLKLNKMYLKPPDQFMNVRDASKKAGRKSWPTLLETPNNDLFMEVE
jgi:hypothetical protein